AICHGGAPAGGSSRPRHEPRKRGNVARANRARDRRPRCLLSRRRRTSTLRAMVSSKASTVDEYIASLPDDRRAAIAAVRDVIRKNLPPGYEEGMQYGMIGWYVPLSRYPDTYNGQPLGVVALASQKQYMSLYLMAVYASPKTLAWFT